MKNNSRWQKFRATFVAMATSVATFLGGCAHTTLGDDLYPEETAKPQWYDPNAPSVPTYNPQPPSAPTYNPPSQPVPPGQQAQGPQAAPQPSTSAPTPAPVTPAPSATATPTTPTPVPVIPGPAPRNSNPMESENGTFVVREGSATVFGFATQYLQERSDGSYGPCFIPQGTQVDSEGLLRGFKPTPQTGLVRVKVDEPDLVSKIKNNPIVFVHGTLDWNKVFLPSVPALPSTSDKDKPPMLPGPIVHKQVPSYEVDGIKRFESCTVYGPYVPKTPGVGF